MQSIHLSFIHPCHLFTLYVYFVVYQRKLGNGFVKASCLRSNKVPLENIKYFERIYLYQLLNHDLSACVDLLLHARINYFRDRKKRGFSMTVLLT